MIACLGSETKKEDLSSQVRIIQIFHKGNPSLPKRSHVSSKKFVRTTGSSVCWAVSISLPFHPTE